ncbi:MAG: Rpn family recombination-promoting nuclease/putative transposase [Lachnospiraceae bacterium]|nr:Rpn family recombination-promoting nuclease/putative transposase [Lachnospiraceae bacterium]
MAKNNRDYDNIFKTLKHCHKRLFISVINQTFNRSYPLDTTPIVLPTDSCIENPESEDMEDRDSDLLFRICGDTYLIECQSYEDGTMAIRIAEYAFLSARNDAKWENGRVILSIPAYTVIYVKSNNRTPSKTEITFNFPNGETIYYDCENVLLTNYTKEQLIECRLFPYIPYYIIRYENEISRNGNIEPALADLEYFRNELSKLYQNNELSAEELLDIMSYTNRIVKHLTDGNQYEERMVRVMGGKVEETPSQELKRLENEKIALNLFKNGVAYDTVRKSISNDIIDDSTLKGLMNLALQTI